METDETKQPEQPRSLEEQLKELFKKANVSLMMGQFPSPEPEGGAKEAAPEQADGNARLDAIRKFNLKPRNVRDYLDRFVVRQDDAKKVLSVAICDHYNHVRRCVENQETRQREYSKHSILVLGPTGVGKTYLVRCIAQLIGVPFVKADATKFSETGYVGRDVEDLVRDLVQAANGDTELAQYGIIYLDEVDKIAGQAGMAGRDVSGRGVQINLLKLMEETDVGLFSQTDLIGQMRAIMDMQRGKDTGRRTINTRHILFIASGAFGPLAEKVRARLRSSRIGFTDEADRKQDESEFLRLATTQDFIDFGFEPEFVGRLPVRVVCDPLSSDDLEAIMLKSEGNILEQYKADFAGYGIDVRLEPDVTRAIAVRAAAEKTGARGLMTVLEKTFRNFKFELPSTPLRSLVVTRPMVDNPAAGLDDCMRQGVAERRQQLVEEVGRFAELFQRNHGIQLVFRKDAAEYIADQCLAGNKSVADFCEGHFKDLEYALKLVAGNTGQAKVSITRKMAEDPRTELSRIVAASFNKKG